MTSFKDRHGLIKIQQRKCRFFVVIRKLRSILVENGIIDKVMVLNCHSETLEQQIIDVSAKLCSFLVGTMFEIPEVALTAWNYNINNYFVS